MVFWVLIACGDCKTSLSGNNTSNLEGKEKVEKFESHTNILHVSLINITADISACSELPKLVYQNWYKSGKDLCELIWIVRLNHKTRYQSFFINSEVTQNTAISLVFITAAWFLQLLLAQTGHKSSFPLLSAVTAHRWIHSDDTYFRFRVVFF